MTLREIYRRCTQQGECKLWKGGLSRNGYPYIHDREKWERSLAAGKGGGSRSGRVVVWKLKHGSEPTGVVIMKCGNRLCLNPAHMHDGTRSDVQKQAAAMGRFRTVARRVAQALNLAGQAKLNHTKAAEIRAALAPYKGKRNERRAARMRELAAQYGVCLTAIRDVYSGKRWNLSRPLLVSSVWTMAANDAEAKCTSAA